MVGRIREQDKLVKHTTHQISRWYRNKKPRQVPIYYRIEYKK